MSRSTTRCCRRVPGRPPSRHRPLGARAVQATTTGPPGRPARLCGVVLSALFESVTSFLIFRGNPQATQSVLFRLLGSFGLASWDQLSRRFDATLPVAARVSR